MDLVKKVIVLVCSIILVGFTLTDFHSVIAEDPAYAGHLFVNKPEKQTLTAHEKKSHPDSDANREEAGIMWKYLRSGKQKAARGLALSTIFLAGSAVALFRIFENRHYLGGLLLQVVYMARFLYELSVQKDKDGKKRTSARRLLLSFQDSSKI